MHPIMAEIGPLALRWYGVMIGAAILAGLWLAAREGERQGFGREKIYDFGFSVVLAGIVGARLYFVLFSDLSRYLARPWEILAIWQGGLAIHGAIIAGVAVAVWFTWKEKIPFWKWADTLAPSLVLGQAIGRIGCFLNGDAHGAPTALPWGLVYSPESPAGQMFPGQPLHPTQIYEFGFNLVIFGILWRLRGKSPFDGFLFLMYAILYSSARIFVEHFRADQLTYFGWVPAAQAAGAAAIAVSLAFWFFLSRKGETLRPIHHPPC